MGKKYQGGTTESPVKRKNNNPNAFGGSGMKRVGSRWVKTHINKKQKTKREMTKEVKEKTGEVERLEGDMKETLETVHVEVAKMKQEHLEKVMELEGQLKETMNKMKDALKEKKKKEKAYTKKVKELR